VEETLRKQCPGCGQAGIKINSNGRFVEHPCQGFGYRTPVQIICPASGSNAFPYSTVLLPKPHPFEERDADPTRDRQALALLEGAARDDRSLWPEFRMAADLYELRGE
jgi:hypothetical protein